MLRISQSISKKSTSICILSQNHNYGLFNEKSFNSKLLCLHNHNAGGGGGVSSVVGQQLILSRQFSMASIITSISTSTPVITFQEGLVQLHDTTGLPWWATIILSTFLLRTIITLPLAIYQNKITARLENIATIDMPDLVKELKMETVMAKKKFNLSDPQARILYNRSLKKQWNNLIVRDNCHPMKTMIVVWGQIPLWIIQSMALRNLLTLQPDPSILWAKIAFTELSMGGFIWIPNLLIPDASFILPITLGLLNLTIIEIQMMSRTKESSKMQKYVSYFFRTLSVAMIPIAATVPAGLSFYWTLSSCYGLGQNLLLMSPKLKELTGVPKSASFLTNPYRHLMNKTSLRLTVLQTKLGLQPKK